MLVRQIRCWILLKSGLRVVTGWLAGLQYGIGIAVQKCNISDQISLGRDHKSLGRSHETYRKHTLSPLIDTTSTS